MRHIIHHVHTNLMHQTRILRRHRHRTPPLRQVHAVEKVTFQGLPEWTSDISRLPHERCGPWYVSGITVVDLARLSIKYCPAKPIFVPDSRKRTIEDSCLYLALITEISFSNCDPSALRTLIPCMMRISPIRGPGSHCSYFDVKQLIRNP